MGPIVPLAAIVAEIEKQAQGRAIENLQELRKSLKGLSRNGSVIERHLGILQSIDSLRLINSKRRLAASRCSICSRFQVTQLMAIGLPLDPDRLFSSVTTNPLRSPTCGF
jgi:hypothetical protein